MGPRNYGIGSTARRRGLPVNAPPTAPDSGSGGAGTLRGTAVAVGNTARGWRADISPAVGEVEQVTTGRVTLAMVNTTVLVLIAFYYWTRSAQGGG